MATRRTRDHPLAGQRPRQGRRRPRGRHPRAEDRTHRRLADRAVHPGHRSRRRSRARATRHRAGRRPEPRGRARARSNPTKRPRKLRHEENPRRSSTPPTTTAKTSPSPKSTGTRSTRIALNFSGSVMLDRSATGDVALYNRVHSESTIELWVEAKWGGTAATPATNRDGDLDVIVGRKTLRIESIRVLDADVLGAVEGLELVRAAVQKGPRRRPRRPDKGRHGPDARRNSRVDEEPRTYLRLVKWDEHQHYKGRGIERPTWIKFYATTLDNPDLIEQTASCRLLADMLLLVAARTGNRIPENAKTLGKLRPFVAGNLQKIGEDSRESRLHRTGESHRPRSRSGCSRAVAARRV